MNKLTAWLDEVHLLQIEGSSDDIHFLMESNDSPIILGEDISADCWIHHIQDHLIELFCNCELPLGKSLFIKWGNYHIPIYPRKIIQTDWFDTNYTAEKKKIGTFCSQKETTFSVWAPTATSFSLILNQKTIPMKRQEKGIWFLQIDGDWHGSPYQFEVTVNGRTTRVNDPYSKALTANSEQSVLVDLERTYPLSLQRPNIPINKTIIYELHVRDATIHPNSGVKNKGTFLGLSEYPTKTKNGYSTGLSYIKELGITHVELLPVNDFARVDDTNPTSSYNWGYDPLFYQVPEGSYATDPTNPLSRVNECKRMIDAFHEHEIGVIIDVVFNHMYIEKNIDETVFERIVPGYYFRYHEDGTISNGSGCGNDLATERTMVRKFIVDTIDYWLTEYKVDGFRFDLMGLIDIETMDVIQKRTNLEQKPILLLGEGWDLPTALPPEQKSTVLNANKLAGIGFFNDQFRDTLKGPLFHNDVQGYTNGKGKWVEKLPAQISGSCLEQFGHVFAPNVTQTINYVECHDNHTLLDHLKWTNPDDSLEIHKKIHQLATGLTLISQGIPFLHAGQEWFRTKYGDENSYRSGDDINRLDWNSRESEKDNIEFVKVLIALRKKYEEFRFGSKEMIKNRFYVLKAPAKIFAFTLLGEDEDFAVYINPLETSHPIQLPSPGKWELMASNNVERKKYSKGIHGENTSIGGYELAIYKKKIVRS